MKTKNRLIGILISTIILLAISLTGIFKNNLQDALIFLAALIGLNLLIPYIWGKIRKEKVGG
ncbi:MAG: hypothetical protein HY796_03205 [Elusimicrobia bacterium]|nr:hypothetical protein [Elusimicrobiota bacterium]